MESATAEGELWSAVGGAPSVAGGDGAATRPQVIQGGGYAHSQQQQSWIPACVSWPLEILGPRCYHHSYNPRPFVFLFWVTREMTRLHCSHALQPLSERYFDQLVSSV